MTNRGGSLNGSGQGKRKVSLHLSVDLVMKYGNWVPVRAPLKAVCRVAAHHQRSVRRKTDFRVPGGRARGLEKVWPLIWKGKHKWRSSRGIHKMAMTPGRVMITCWRKVSSTRARQLDAPLSQREKLHLQTVSFTRLRKNKSPLTGYTSSKRGS
jgi:hypothetical protein